MIDGCELCGLERRTAWHYEDELMVICDCLTCRIPMLVFKSHGPRMEEEHFKAREKIIEIYGKRLIKIRVKARKLLAHEHWRLYLEALNE